MRVHLEVVLYEAGAIVTAVVVLKLALRSRPFIRLNALDVAASEGAEIAGCAESQQEVAEGLKEKLSPRVPQVVAPVVLGQEEGPGPGFVPSVNPGKIVGPRVVLVFVGKVVPEIANEAETPQRAQDGGFGSLIKEPVRRRHPQRCRRWSARAVSLLRGARKAHSALTREVFGERGSQTQTGDVVVGVERLGRALPGKNRRAGVALGGTECSVLVEVRQVHPAGKGVLGRDEIVAVLQVVVLPVAGGEAIGREAQAGVAAGGENRLGHGDEVPAVGRLHLEQAEGYGIDGSRGGRALIAAIKLLPSSKSQVPGVGLAARQLVITRTELGCQGCRRSIPGKWRQDGIRRGSSVYAVHLARSLVRAEKEQLPSPDGTAHGGAELILFQIRFRLPGRTPEKRVGVEHVVPHEVAGITVKFVLATLGDQGRIG